jgi:outer membrane protein assembly factor BamB/tRNA A-37 threonylcarbamoyl transferase component Bud32
MVAIIDERCRNAGGATLENQRATHDLADSGSTRKPSDHLQPGVILVSRYSIQSVVGIGGMGAVYCARDLHFPNVVKRVAVKEMINLARDPAIHNTIVRNFEREANILATLNHPSIPRIYDYFSQDDRSYLIIEFIEGKDLEEILLDSEDFIPEVQVVNWAIELCDVISYLHNNKPEPIIFRDIKPSNIMVDIHGHILLVDFGIAKTFRTGQKGTMIGTEGYSPPEQYKGEATQRADIYALGATLHHLLTKRDPRLEPPFSFEERKIRPINPAVSAELEAVIYTALNYDPEKRYSSAEEMKDALIASAKKTGLLHKLPAAIKPLTREISEITASWKFECEDEIRGTPVYFNGSIYIGAYDNNLYALNAVNGEFNWKFATEGGIVCKPAIFEGNIYIGSEDQRLYCINLRSGQEIWSYYSNGPIRSSPHIAEGHIFIGSDDAYLHAVNALSGRRAWRVDAGAPVRSTPLLVGENVYFGTEAGDLFCIDLGGNVKWRFKAKRALTSSPIYANGIIYVGSVDTLLYALDAKSGYIIWRFRMSKASISTPFINDNFIFTGSVDSHIYCIDLHSAKEIWNFATDNQVTSSPITYQDSVYCGSVDGAMYCLEFRTGRLRWKFQTGGPITGIPVIANDVLYFGSSDHKIYAIVL